MSKKLSGTIFTYHVFIFLNVQKITFFYVLLL